MALPTKEAENRTVRCWLIAIITIAVLARLAAAFYLGNEIVNLPGTFDQVSYDMLAKRFLDGHGLTVAQVWWPITPAGEPTAHWSFLYTFYLVAVYSLFGYQPLVARILQGILVGVFMPWLAYRLGRRHFNPQVGLVAAGIVAFYVYFVYYTGALMTEMFYITGILWVLDIAGHLGQRDSSKATLLRGDWLLLGLALGITVLLRQVFLLFIPFLYLWLLWRSYQGSLREAGLMLRKLIGTTIVLLLMILPWTYRNYQVFNQFVLLNTNAGFAFFWGNHPIHGYDFIPILPPDGPSYQQLIPEELRHLNEAALDRALLKESLATIQADPVRYLILSLSRAKEYFKFWPTADSSTISNLSRVLSFGILWPFMLYGLLAHWRHIWSSERFILYLFIVIYTGVHLLTWSLIRYRLPIDAVLIIFAGSALLDLRTRLFNRYINRLEPQQLS